MLFWKKWTYRASRIVVILPFGKVKLTLPSTIIGWCPWSTIIIVKKKPSWPCLTIFRIDEIFASSYI
jgi:hypothetical protein